MFTKILLICLLAAISMTTVIAEKKYHNQSELIDDTLDFIFTCMQELEISPEVCGELLSKDKDHNDKKYDSCKCFGSCVAKKLGTMDNDTGKWDWAKVKVVLEVVENEMLKNESNIMLTHCIDEVNTHCTASYELVKCLVKNSPMAKEMVNFLVAKDTKANEGEAAN